LPHPYPIQGKKNPAGSVDATILAQIPNVRGQVQRIGDRRMRRKTVRYPTSSRHWNGYTLPRESDVLRQESFRDLGARYGGIASRLLVLLFGDGTNEFVARLFVMPPHAVQAKDDAEG
jgi:hypothetical protein